MTTSANKSTHIARLLALPALLACACFSLTGCGTSGSKEFSSAGYPFTFEYPGAWTLTRSAPPNYGTSANGLRSVSVALKEPFDQVTITQYKLKKKLPAGVNGNQNEVDRIVKSLSHQAKGTAGDSKAVKYGGLPGYQYVIQYPAGEGVKLNNKLTFLFKAQNEFQINCQSSAKNADELNDGCDEILESLKFN
jgi:hypothetical protein